MSERFDAIVVGTGAAGLSTALSAARAMPNFKIAVISKGVFGLDGASCWAQGGIAAALSNADSPMQHALDSVNAGGKACNKAAARWLAEAAPESAQWLSQLGVNWDRSAQGVMLARGSAHSTARLLHAGGDATGAEIMRTLRDVLSQLSNVQVFEFSEVDRLLKMLGRVVGVQLRNNQGQAHELYAQQVVLATGGLGQLYRHTTNPFDADGSGIFLAHSAGAELADMEFMQFHPTALASRMEQDAQLPLISEALRGYGARLVNERGVRFMATTHELADLAPTDVVARAVFMQMEQGHEVFLDARALGDNIRSYFPTVFAACKTRNFDPRVDLIPVVPAAHYLMGGVRVDLHAMSTLPGLYAVGEAACTGAHGGNRLSGNGLMEAVAFGRTLGERIARQPLSNSNLKDDGSVPARRLAPAPVSESLVYNRLKNLMWGFVGIVRSEAGLQGAIEQIHLLERRCLSGSKALNQIALAKIMIEAALRRKQSLGAHVIDNTVKRGLGSAVA